MIAITKMRFCALPGWACEIADDNSKTLSLFLLVTITLLNAVWRAAGVLAARIELMLSRQDHDKSES